MSGVDYSVGRDVVPPYWSAHAAVMGKAVVSVDWSQGQLSISHALKCGIRTNLLECRIRNRSHHIFLTLIFKFINKKNYIQKELY